MSNKKIDNLFLGIDPGYDRLGIAIIEKTSEGNENLIFSSCIETSKKDSHSKRLLKICEDLEKIIGKYRPKISGLEKLYFSKNQKTAILVAEARGAIAYMLEKMGVEIYELTPQEIKIAVCGHGSADKKDVASMVKKLLKIDKETVAKIKYDDEYDAIACALTLSASYQQLAILREFDKK